MLGLGEDRELNLRISRVVVIRLHEREQDAEMRSVFLSNRKFLFDKKHFVHGCAASRAEQKLRNARNLNARVCEAHFCSSLGKTLLR